MACRQKFNLRVDVIYGVHHEIGGPERVAQHLRLHLRPVHYVERLDRRLGGDPREILLQACRLWRPDVLSRGQTVPVEGRKGDLIKVHDSKPADAAPQQHVSAVRADSSKTDDHDE